MVDELFFSLGIFIPFFPIIEFIGYIGWIRVAETLLNPWGDDDEDFQINFLINRNFKVICFRIFALGFSTIIRICQSNYMDQRIKSKCAFKCLYLTICFGTLYDKVNLYVDLIHFIRSFSIPQPTFVTFLWVLLEISNLLHSTHFPYISLGFLEPSIRRVSTCHLLFMSHFLVFLEGSLSRRFLCFIFIALILLNKQLVSD